MNEIYNELIGEHIILRKAKSDDYESMLKHVWADEEVYKWMLYAPTLTMDDAILRNERSIEFQKNNYAYYIALKDTNEAIGLCAIKEYEPNRFKESGICIGTKFQGQGYGKEILYLLLNLAFTKLNAIDFEYGYFQDNIKSKKLADFFDFKYSHTEEMIRPWDQERKMVDLCLLSKNEFNKLKDKYTI